MLHHRRSQLSVGTKLMLIMLRNVSKLSRSFIRKNYVSQGPESIPLFRWYSLDVLCPKISYLILYKVRFPNSSVSPRSEDHPFFATEDVSVLLLPFQTIHKRRPHCFLRLSSINFSKCPFPHSNGW